MLELKGLVELHDLHIHHVTIQSELRYQTGANVAGSIKWNRGPGSTRPKNRGFMSGPGEKPAMTKLFGWPGGS